MCPDHPDDLGLSRSSGSPAESEPGQIERATQEFLSLLESAARQEGEVRIISMLCLRNAALACGLTYREAELTALEQQIMPARYQRSFGTVGWEGQKQLLRSRVSVIGAGGLGGWIIEGLARMGVGQLIIVDGDVFEENNLNRQALCWEDSLGRSKAELAHERASKINAALDITSLHLWADEKNLPDILQGSDTVVDALDKLPIRMTLQRVCAQLGIPLVHGAIGGFIGQVTTIYPGDAGLRALYGDGPVPERGAEVEWGNPAATPMLVAAWQVMEVIKLLTGRGELLRGQLLFLDGESATTERYQLG